MEINVYEIILLWDHDTNLYRTVNLFEDKYDFINLDKATYKRGTYVMIQNGEIIRIKER